MKITLQKLGQWRRQVKGLWRMWWWQDGWAVWEHPRKVPKPFSSCQGRPLAGDEKIRRRWPSGKGWGVKRGYSPLGRKEWDTTERLKWTDFRNRFYDLSLHILHLLGREMGLMTKKRCTTWELQVKFYLGQNEDCSPRGGISDRSERLLQSGNGGKSIYKVLVKGEFNNTNHSFYKRFFVSHEGLMSPWSDLVLL